MAAVQADMELALMFPLVQQQVMVNQVILAAVAAVVVNLVVLVALVVLAVVLLAGQAPVFLQVPFPIVMELLALAVEAVAEEQWVMPLLLAEVLVVQEL
jgi:hypothetical protein